MAQRHIPFRTTATAAVVAALLLLSGCGSSHHDSTGPTQQETGVTPGTYRGPITLTISGGGQSISEQTTIVIVLAADGTVQASDFPPTKLQGSSFSTSSSSSVLNDSSLNCTKGTFGINGTFAGQTVSGNLFSNGIVCNGIAFTVSGGYTAQRSASELPRGGAGHDAFGVIQGTLEKVLSK